MNFRAKLSAAWQRHDSLLCVGLDPDLKRFPAHLKGRPDAVLAFCKGIVDATADLACAFKPQIAYFAAARAEDQLQDLIAYIHEKHPSVPVVLMPSAVTSAPPPSSTLAKPSSATTPMR